MEVVVVVVVRRSLADLGEGLEEDNRHPEIDPMCRNVSQLLVTSESKESRHYNEHIQAVVVGRMWAVVDRKVAANCMEVVRAAAIDIAEAQIGHTVNHTYCFVFDTASSALVVATVVAEVVADMVAGEMRLVVEG